MSHHSSSPEAEKAMHEAMQRLLGKFPDGKLNKDDEGGIAMVVELQDKRVVIQFPKPVAWIGMTADEAILLAQDLIKKAREAGHTRPLTIAF